MTIERHVRLIRKGGTQTVLIPHELELPGDEAVVRKEGDRLVLRAVSPQRLLDVLARLSPLEEDFPPIADPAPREPEF